MSIHRDKERGQFVFSFEASVQGAGRVRRTKRLPKVWNRAQADAYDRQTSAELYAQASGVGGNSTELIEDAVALYLERRVPQLKHGKDYALELAAIYPFYQGRPLSALADISRAIQLRSTKGDGTPSAPATIKNRISYLRAAVNYAWRHHNFGGEAKPTERMSVPVVNNTSFVYATREEMLRVCLLTKRRDVRAMFRRLYYSGKRFTEGSLAVVNQAGTAYFIPDTKNSTPDWQPIHPKARTAFQVKPPSYSTARDWFKKSADKLGYKHLTIHKLRHGTATAILEGGGDLKDVQAVLNHKSAQSAMRYAHFAQNVKLRAVGFIGKKAA
jgi:integrase